MAVTCVSIIPVGTNIGGGGTSSAVLSRPVIGLDATCASGMVIMSKDDLKLTVVPEAVSTERVQDMYGVFIAFLVVFAGLWGLKQIYRIFSGDMERD